MKLVVYKQSNGQLVVTGCVSQGNTDAVIEVAFSKHKATTVRVYDVSSAYDLAPKIEYVTTPVPLYPSSGG